MVNLSIKKKEKSRPRLLKTRSSYETKITAVGMYNLQALYSLGLTLNLYELSFVQLFMTSSSHSSLSMGNFDCSPYHHLWQNR